MKKQIIDEAKVLMEMSEAELTELLLLDKYNKSNLRQLIRECLKVANEYKTALDYEIYQRKDTEECLDRYEKRL